jgi:branched-chain amino acid transport system ATP-binding protein
MLEINNISVNYGCVEALQDVSLSVGKNEIVALIGNNGAGKSTTLRAISGLVKVSRGGIMFNGDDITNKPVHEISAMGVVHVPEGRKIFYKLSVKENLLMGAYTCKDKNTIAESLANVLETFSILNDRINQQGGTLSGGEQQMLAVGRALMAQPKIILFDEPSLGLAPLVVETVVDNIIKI